ncbi:MAG: GIY-YIG nuclease family protein [Bacteroidota bacterium]
MFCTYIIQSEKTGTLYIGQTQNLPKRIKKHNSNLVKSTKGKGPWRVIFSVTFETRSEAVKLERKLKSFKKREYLFKWIKKFSN